MIQETARDLIDELSELAAEQEAKSTPEEPPQDAGRPSCRVLCIPLRDQADDIGGQMLAKLLARERISVSFGGVGALTSELVEQVETLQADLVVLSIVPPLPPRSSRLLCRRLHDRYPQLPLVIGFWSGGRADDVRRRLADDQAEVATTLSDAVERIRAIAARPKLADSPAAAS